MRTYLLPLYALLLLALATPALATDGVLEINQTCAVQTGCFAGDAAGFPVTIASTGSYRLTGSLSAPAGTNGLSITASRVSIDLNGFEVAGTGSCTGFPVTSCSGGGGIGIFSSGSMLTVRNGTLRGFNHGINARERGVVIDEVLVEQNALAGMIIGHNARVSNCRAIQNGGIGIFLSDNDNNGETFPNGLSIAENNVASGNVNSGIRIGFAAARLSDNVADNNSVFGISVAFGHSGALAGNVVFDNGAGTIDFGSAVETGVNLCNGSTTCP